MTSPASVPASGWITTAACGAVLVGLLVFGWQQAEPQGDRASSPEQLCPAYDRFDAAMRNQGPAAQTQRVRAVSELAEVAGRYPVVPQPDSDPVFTAQGRLLRVLDAPYSSVADAYAASLPAAVACDKDWRRGSPWWRP